uniref:Zona pellucida sperm-binding protein 3 n=1 Tax=Varanus komodoensis TaxID=61221 RepID=A0A8D2LEJ6_VARKO
MGRRAGVRLLLLPGLLLALLWAPCAGGPGQARPHAGAVAVTCEPHRMVVAVHRDLFGGGRLVAPADLALGRPRCPPASVDAGATVVRFEAGLHECGSTVQVMTPTLLIYRTSLFYTPSLASGRVILRTSATEIPIECRYPRTDNVSSGALQPHWVPFQATAAAKARLGFSLRLMKDDWSAERTSALFQLGEALCVQAEVLGDAPLPLRLFVDHCAASLSPDASSGPQYAIVASSGCLVDGRQEGVSSTFLSPRPRPEALRFTIDAFRFAGDPRKVIYITCHLKAVPAEQAPDAGHKACSFDAERSGASPGTVLLGDGDVSGNMTDGESRERGGALPSPPPRPARGGPRTRAGRFTQPPQDTPQPQCGRRARESRRILQEGRPRSWTPPDPRCWGTWAGGCGCPCALPVATERLMGPNAGWSQQAASVPSCSRTQVHAERRGGGGGAVRGPGDLQTMEGRSRAGSPATGSGS